MRERLIQDYYRRSEKRIKMLEMLREEGDYADVIREAQEVVELLLKALLMAAGLDVPKTHDVSGYLGEHLEFFPEGIRKHYDQIRRISRELRKDRELSFYGALDWIPSEEYTHEDATQAIAWAKEIREWVGAALQSYGIQQGGGR